MSPQNRASLPCLVSINKQFFSEDKAKISIFDRGFLFGDSIYEVTLTYKGLPLFLDEHLRRLWHSAQALAMAIPFTREELKEEISRGLHKIALPRVYIRLIITRGEVENKNFIGLDPNSATPQNLIIIFRQLPPNPTEWYEKGVHMAISDVMRNPKEAIDPNIKSGNYLNNVLAMGQAKAKGAFDAIMLNHKGHVTEATTSNLWIVQKGKLITPPLQAGLLSGITRSVILKLAKEKGLSVEESNFDTPTLMSAQEVFFTSSTKELVPITRIEGRPIGQGRPGKITQKLHQFYQEFIRESLGIR